MLASRKSHSGAIFNSVELVPQQEFAVVATVCQMINMSGQDIAVGTRHRGSSRMVYLRSRKRPRNIRVKPFYTLLMKRSPI